MAFNTKVDVADTELESDEFVAEAEDVTLEDERLSRPSPKVKRTRKTRKRTSPRTR